MEEKNMSNDIENMILIRKIFDYENELTIVRAIRKEYMRCSKSRWDTASHLPKFSKIDSSVTYVFNL